jgi:hypothetical protein
LKNIQALLKEAGLTLQNIVKTTVFLTDLADFSAMNEIYQSFFTAPYPARSTIQVAALPKNSILEIEVLAVKNINAAVYAMDMFQSGMIGEAEKAGIKNEDDINVLLNEKS